MVKVLGHKAQLWMVPAESAVLWSGEMRVCE